MTTQGFHTNRVAIVTGASRGFGLATARALAADGWSLVIDARDEVALAQAVDELSARHLAASSFPDAPGTANGPHSIRNAVARVVGIPGDVTGPMHRRALVKAAAEQGGLDLLVNNASMLGPSPQPELIDYPIDVYRQLLEVNVIAPLALVQESSPLLRERHGIIVNITSDASTEPYPGWGGYGSSKAALNQLSNVLASELADLTVIWFDPGDMNTRMHQEAFPGEDISDRADPSERVPALMTVLERAESGYFAAAEVLGTT